MKMNMRGEAEEVEQEKRENKDKEDTDNVDSGTRRMTDSLPRQQAVREKEKKN